MSEERQQSLKEYPYEVVTHPNTVPPVHHNQPTIPRDCAVTIHPAPETSQGDIFVPLAAQRGYYEPLNVDYPRYYGSFTPSDGVGHVHHTQCAPLPTENNNITPAQPTGLAPKPVAVTANGPPFFDNPIDPMAENVPVSSGRLPSGTTQGFSGAGYNLAVPGAWMASVYRDLATRFINNPQSNIVGIRMESSGGHSKVMIELDISNAA